MAQYWTKDAAMSGSPCSEHIKSVIGVIHASAVMEKITIVVPDIMNGRRRPKDERHPSLSAPMIGGTMEPHMGARAHISEM